jgi:TRAP-type uncharacterized transport system substrate-binding protein
MLKSSTKALCVSTLLVLSPSVSMAEPLVFSSGIEGGGYWSAATRLQTVAAELGLEVQVEPSTGSLHNLARLLDAGDPTGLVLAQADALQHYLDEHPGESQKIEILENIGQECVFVITGSDSAIRSDADLQEDRDYQIAISSPDSGVAVTYSYMTTLAPEMAATSVQYTDTGAAMNGLGATGSEAADAVMLVHRPKEHSPEVDLALRNPDQFRFVQISDERFNSKLPNGDAVYSSLKLAIPVPDSEERRPVTTICVKGLLVGSRDKISSEQRDTLGTMINTYWMKVYATGQ